jgi:Mg2+-importing ATPase
VASVLSCCDRVRVGGRVEPLGPWRARIAAQVEALGAEGQRVVGVAMRGLGERTEASVADEREMLFLGVLALSDPPKRDAAAAVAGLERLGVHLKLVTGDHRSVAAQVAREVGIPSSALALGAELENLTELALAQRVGEIDVFAEVEPDLKERIVRALRHSQAVGFLGDGINDAAALHAADVGISVDSATDVAKDAAQIVLLEKDLGVLLDGVREGRRTFANTLKYVFMATSANFGNMFSMAAASLFLPFLPLLPKQVLIANLLTDLPEMTICTDRVVEELIARPQRWDVHFIRRFMLTFGLVSSIFDFGTFAVLRWGLGAGDVGFRTGWLVESIVSASLIVLVIRTRRPAWRSRPGKHLAATTLGTIGLALLLPSLPFAGSLSLQPLPASVYGALAGVIALYVATAELAKRAFYQRRASG